MSPLLAGYGERTVTPPLGVDLCGYGFHLGRRAESVLDDLKCRAVYLEGGGRRLVLISCDVIGFTIEEADVLRAKIAAALDLPAPASFWPRRIRIAGRRPSPCPGLGTRTPAP